MTISGPTELAPQVHPDDRAGLLAAHQDVAARPGGSATVTVRVRDGAGGWRSSEVTVANQLDDPAVGSVVMWVHSPDPDPTLVFRAGHDSLTALANRDTLLGRLDAALSDQGRCAVLYLDLDGFKVVNDAFGHAAGDHLLVVTAERLRHVVRPGDTVGRLGGDEFVIVAAGVDRASDALGLAERVRAVVGRPVPLPGRVVTITASVGVALGAGHQTATLLDEADLALYRAKGDGRDRVRLYRHDMGRRGAGGVERDAVLRGALEDGGLTATFQPVVELASGTVVGAQARLSLRGAGELAASPHLVDSAERSGLSVSLGAGLLDLACQQLAASSNDELYSIAVAVSPRQLADPRLPALVDATRRAHGVPAHRLCLDISERTVTDLPPGGKQMLAQLLALGVSLAVDDFGSDPSGAGLRALQDAGISVLKIDEAFVAGIGRQRSDTEVVRAFVRLGQSMGMVTVAKGVTTAEQVEFLTELGCRLGVGPYFGDPAPASFAR